TVHADPAEQVAAMIYTSGTSGSPKAVMLTHANLQFAAQGARDVRRLGPGDRLYGVMPMAHVVGLSTQVLGSLMSGATLLLVPRFDPMEAARTLAEEGITVFTGVPVMFAKLLDWSRANGVAFAAPQLRLATVSGAPLLPGLKSEVEKVLGMPLHNGYGLTELSPTVAVTTSEAPRTDCSVGQPMPGLELRFVDEQGADVAPGEVGELWVRGPNVMKGYYRSPKLTEKAVDPQGWFNTGDLARLGPDGALHIAGRTKELIIRSGFNVYPVEVEQVLDSHSDVVQSAVVGRPVEDNEEVVAFVELAAGSTLTEAELGKYLRERLSPYKLPAEIRFLAQFPAGSTGKVLKHVLKDMARQPA
ncbi:MAG TPA: AMP-binding protein, partial [Burkholderiaceae bacterium]|nr:AMP-binding protein [Burkholderiaceae bacterium]